MENSDSDLLAQYRNGDVKALEQLVARYRRPLFRFILNMTDGRDDADEIFQEVWFRAIKNIGGYRDNRFLSWMFRITRNLIIDRSRARKRMLSLDKTGEYGASLLDSMSKTGATPADRAGCGDIGRKITKAVNMLPIEQKEVFLMRMEEALTFKEISVIQRVSINTALARMQYALAKLKHALKDEYRALGRCLDP